MNYHMQDHGAPHIHNSTLGPRALMTSNPFKKPKMGYTFHQPLIVYLLAWVNQMMESGLELTKVVPRA